jgi:hypothetical protein
VPIAMLVPQGESPRNALVWPCQVCARATRRRTARPLQNTAMHVNQHTSPHTRACIHTTRCL